MTRNPYVNNLYSISGWLSLALNVWIFNVMAYFSEALYFPTVIDVPWHLNFNAINTIFPPIFHFIWIISVPGIEIQQIRSIVCSIYIRAPNGRYHISDQPIGLLRVVNLESDKFQPNFFICFVTKNFILSANSQAAKTFWLIATCTLSTALIIFILLFLGSVGVCVPAYYSHTNSLAYCP